MAALTWLFDPFCGWCYGAAPALHALIAAGHDVSLAPTGLFCAPGRAMTPDMAAYIRDADQRIARMTGQPFSDAYRAEILGRPTPIDSTMATLALTAVALAAPAPAREAEALAAFQAARYVGAQDISDGATLADVLRGIGLPAAAARLAAPDEALLAATRERIAAARGLMARLGLNGVPALVAGEARSLPNGLLFGPRDALLAAIG